MANPMIKFVNAETGEEIEREMNAAEFKQYETEQKADELKKNEDESKAAQKIAVLNKIGLTAEEAAVLLQ